MEVPTDLKRRRDDGEVIDASPYVKRLRTDLFIDILDDSTDAADEDVASVMRSLEDEIVGRTAPPTSPVLWDLTDLGFLFEATDNELGLPPPTEAEGFGEIFGVGEEIGGYDAFVAEDGGEEGAAEVAGDGVAGLDDVALEFAEVLSGDGDFGDGAWWWETLPAV